MIEFYVEAVETFCGKKRCQVLISLRVPGLLKENMIMGVPESCNCEDGCSKGAFYLLKASTWRTSMYILSLERLVGNFHFYVCKAIEV